MQVEDGVVTGSGVPFSLLTLHAFYDNLKEYPPGVPLLDYGAGRITYGAETILMDDKGTWTVGRLDAELAPPANEAAPTQREPRGGGDPTKHGGAPDSVLAARRGDVRAWAWREAACAAAGVT